MPFEENRVLFGPDTTDRIVSVELAGENEVQVYRRPADGAPTVVETARFQPFIWTAGEVEGIESEGLSGGLTYDRLIRCAGWGDFQSVRNDLRERSGVRHFALTDPVQQYLTASGRTLFQRIGFRRAAPHADRHRDVLRGGLRVSQSRARGGSPHGDCRERPVGLSRN